MIYSACQMQFLTFLWPYSTVFKTVKSRVSWSHLQINHLGNASLVNLSGPQTVLNFSSQLGMSEKFQTEKSKSTLQEKITHKDLLKITSLTSSLDLHPFSLFGAKFRALSSGDIRMTTNSFVVSLFSYFFCLVLSCHVVLYRWKSDRKINLYLASQW